MKLNMAKRFSETVRGLFTKGKVIPLQAGSENNTELPQTGIEPGENQA